MKMGYIALSILIIISLLLIFFTSFLGNITRDITAQIDNINKLIDIKDYKEAFKNYKKLKNKWDKTKKLIQIQVEAEELDNISSIFAELDSYFRNNMYIDFYKSSYRLNFYINHLYEKSIINIDNIF